MKKQRVIVTLSILLFLVTSSFAQVVKFVVMGDNRPQFPVQKQPYVYHKIVDKAVSLRPHAIFSTGDIILGSEDVEELHRMYDEFIAANKKFGDIPLYITPGNHDIEATEKYNEEYKKRFGPTYQCVDIENCRFILLNTYEPGERRKITGKQFEWLTKRLEEPHGKENIFVFVHEPLYPKFSHIGSSLDAFPEERDRLADLLKKHNVDMVFVGHNHHYNYSVIDGLHQMTTGGAGAPLYAWAPEYGGYNHFIFVYVNGKDIDYRFVVMENEVLEASDLRREGEYEESLRMAKKAIEIMPDHPQTYVQAALTYHRMKDEQHFNEMYEKIIETQGDELEAVLCLAFTAYRIEENQDDGIYFFKKAIEVDPGDYRAYYMAGRIYDSRKEYSEAVNYYKQALNAAEDPGWKELIGGLLKRAQAQLEKHK